MTSNKLADLPVYSAAEAARYVGTSAASIGRWRGGYSYPTADGGHRSGPVTSGASQGLLSFNDLLEVAVVAAARRAVPMRSIRQAVESAREIYGVERPLILLDFKHDGRDIFTREQGAEAHRVVNLSRSGQLAWSHIQDVLEDLEYSDGVALRWYPAGRQKPIVIDPQVSFGRPYVVHRGISTDVVRSRFQAGESLEEIADDLGLTAMEAQEAIRFELPIAA